MLKFWKRVRAFADRRAAANCEHIAHCPGCRRSVTFDGRVGWKWAEGSGLLTCDCGQTSHWKSDVYGKVRLPVLKMVR